MPRKKKNPDTPSRAPKRKLTLIEIAAILQALAPLPDDTNIDAKTVGIVWGGTKPVDISTVYRGAQRGLIEKPTKAPGSNISRWTLGQARRARALRNAEA